MPPRKTPLQNKTTSSPKKRNDSSEKNNTTNNNKINDKKTITRKQNQGSSSNLESKIQNKSKSISTEKSKKIINTSKNNSKNVSSSSSVTSQVSTRSANSQTSNKSPNLQITTRSNTSQTSNKSSNSPISTRSSNSKNSTKTNNSSLKTSNSQSSIKSNSSQKSTKSNTSNRASNSNQQNKDKIQTRSSSESQQKSGSIKNDKDNKDKKKVLNDQTVMPPIKPLSEKEKEILKVLHPLEEAKLIKPNKLTSTQKAITYIILQHDNSCHEDIIVGFLQKHINLVNYGKKDSYRQLPDKRLFHIQTNCTKNNLPLFLENPNKKDEYQCNTPKDLKKKSEKLMKGDNTNKKENKNQLLSEKKNSQNQKEKISKQPKGKIQKEADNNSKKKIQKDKAIKTSDLKKKEVPQRALSNSKTERSRDNSFESNKQNDKTARPNTARHFIPYEDRILDLLKQFPQGATIDQLIETGGDIVSIRGPFMDLPPIQRIRAILVILKSQKLIKKCDGGIWKVKKKSKKKLLLNKFSPIILNDVGFSEVVNQFTK